MSLDEVKQEWIMCEPNGIAGGEAGAVRTVAARAVHGGASLAGGEACSEGRWHVARHRPYEGCTIAERIVEQGFDAKSLRIEVRRPGRDDVLRALFPGYLFVRFATSNVDWTRVLRVNGVIGILSSSSGTPLALPEQEARAVFANVDQFGILRAPKAASSATPKAIRGGLDVLRIWLDRNAAGPFARG